MPNWCANSLYISGSSQNITEIQKLMKGEVQPLYREAVQNSIKFFVAGCARIVNPVYAIEQGAALLFNDSNALIPYEVGEANSSNQAFTSWLDLLKTDPSLTKDVSEKVIALYQQSGLANVTLDTVSVEQFAIIKQLFEKQCYDWFGTFKYEPKDINKLWQQLDEKPTEAHDFDMRLVLPPKLIPEIVGFNGHMLGRTIGALSSYTSYNDLYGIKWPVGYNLQLHELTPKSISQQSEVVSENALVAQAEPASEVTESIRVDFDTPWCPPNPNVLIALSEQYECTISHYYCESGMAFGGYGHYELGSMTDCDQDDLEFSEENEDGFCDIIGPSYILDNVASFGG